MIEMIYLGTITSTHGIKGELKVKSDFEFKDRCFKNGFTIYINNDMYTITSYRTHKQFDMITINNINDINDVINLVGKDVFVFRDDLKLNSNEFLYNDLMSCKIIDNNEELGQVIGLRKSNILLLEIDDDKKYFIPCVDEYIKSVDIKEKKIYTKGAKELVL